MSHPVSVKVGPPAAFALDQNFPNPFNPSTAIRYELPKTGAVKLSVYNILGQEVVTLVEAHQTAGFHTIVWNGLNESKQRVASGVYFYRITVRDGDRVEFATARKMLLLK
ncbi:MAG: T9SS type A sorting domain-containing protein [candidate division Zixibacteria bacterium]|nr:T9SS type A sorting domain-containing protein [candidate division Zixibacteria bacterium]